MSTGAVHNFDATAVMPTYSMTKHAGALTLQLVAYDIPPEDMQVIIFHPGAIFTEAVESQGFTKDSLPWEDGMSCLNIYQPLPLSPIRSDINNIECATEPI